MKLKNKLFAVTLALTLIVALLVTGCTPAEDLASVDADDVKERLAGFEEQLRNLSQDDARRAYLYNEIAWCRLLLAE